MRYARRIYAHGKQCITANSAAANQEKRSSACHHATKGQHRQGCRCGQATAGQGQKSP